MFLLDWINAILQALGLSNKQARIIVLGKLQFLHGDDCKGKKMRCEGDAGYYNSALHVFAR
jgi:hypothetical protein